MPESGEQLKGYIAGFESYFNDQLLFRDTFIGLQKKIKLAFGLSPTANVIAGEGRWLFNNFDDVFGNYQRRHAHSEQEIRAWAQYITERKGWLASRGIAYYFMPVPDKHAIYKQYLPEKDRLRIEQNNIHILLKTLASGESVNSIVDIYPDMLKQKNGFELPLYTPGDTHWNILGAAVATDALVRKMKARFPALDYSLPGDTDYFVEQDGLGGELVAIVGGGKSYKTPAALLKNYATCVGKDKALYTVNSYGLNSTGRLVKDAPHVLQCNGASGLKVLVFRDSFWDKLAYTLAPLFYETYVIKMEGEVFF
ncbi:MAG: hypothetical protein KDI30_02640 [Pseudomonadales bacterium]|nr:hypothetical protein [Pseudomonadales bacterium]